jgi:hypothetical protein
LPKRRAVILEKVQALAAKENGKAIIPDALLDEVTGWWNGRCRWSAPSRSAFSPCRRKR